MKHILFFSGCAIFLASLVAYHSDRQQLSIHLLGSAIIVLLMLIVLQIEEKRK